ncbi:MAG: MFS transporter [Propionicimonas sp.]
MRAGEDNPVIRPGGSIAAPEPPRTRAGLAALRSFNYRLYFVAAAFATTGGWMQRVAIDWLVLELTGNVALVGLSVSLQFAPSLLITPWAGVISDRLSRRHILMVTQSVAVAVNATLATLAISGVVEIWHVFTAASILGVTMAIDSPSRSAFISEMVGPDRLRSAISLNASVFHLGGLVGPMVSGALIAIIGSGPSIAVNATTGLVAIGALLLMRPHELYPSPRAPRRRGQVREAARYVAERPAILWSIVLMGAVAVFGLNLPVLLAASAKVTYGTDATGYGLYSALAASGALLGAGLSARRRTLRLRTVVVTAAVFGVLMALAGLAPWYGGFLVALIALATARVLVGTGAETMTQLSSGLAIRGRVMSFYLMVGLGGQAIGGNLLGWVAELWGSQAGFVVAGGGMLVTTVVVAVVLARQGGLTLSVDLRSLRHPVRIVPRSGEAAALAAR